MLQLNQVCDQKRGRITGLSNLKKKLLSLPFWVKQYLYLELRDDISKYADVSVLDNKTKSDLVQSFIPTPSSVGQRYINRRFNQFAVKIDIPADNVTFLRSLGINKTLIDICNENQWSLIKSSKILVDCIERGLVESINNNSIANNIYYLAGKIRLGEYLLRMNKLSLDQVDRALFTQKEISQQVGQKTKIGELLVNLGFISERDKNDILSLKQNSEIECDVIDESELLNNKIAELERKVETLKFENEGLRQDFIDYQDELVNKSRVITDLESKIEKYQEKKFNLRKLFIPRLSPKNT